MRRLGLVLATLCVARGAARADDWSLHLLGVAQFGYTDNVTSAASGDPNKTWDLYLSAQPGVLATLATPRTTHDFTYTLDGTTYIRKNDQSTLMQRVGYRGFYLTSPRSELVIASNGSFGDSNLFTEPTASGGVVATQRSGSLATRGADADEDFSYLLTEDLRASEGGFGRYQFTRDSNGNTTSATEVGGRLGLVKSFRADSVSGTLALSYLTLTRPVAGVELGDDQLVAHATAAWNHDINREWTSAVSAGVVAVAPRGDGKGQILPVASVTAAYYPAWGSMRVVVQRDVAPNLLIAQNTQNDTAVVTGWLPLPWLRDDPTNPTLSTQATVGVARTRLIEDADGTTLAAYDDLLTDVALNWAVRKDVNVALRYQLIWQGAPTEQAMMEQSSVHGFVRNTVLLQFFGRWPERLAAEVPIRQTLRVDRSNLTPVGDAAQSGGNGGGR